MSQQEFAPESGSHGQDSGNGEDEIYYPQHPYYWSVKPENEAAPRDESPSSYVESTIQPGYQAQDNAANVKQGTYGTNADDQQSANNGSARQQYAPDGDAFEQGYRPYSSYYGGNWRGMPPYPYAQATGYGRMQRRSPFRIVFFVLLAFLLLKPILIVAGLLLATIGALVGGALLFMLLMAFFIFGLGIFRRGVRPGYRGRGRYW